jgi:hypothetical protein
MLLLYLLSVFLLTFCTESKATSPPIRISVSYGEFIQRKLKVLLHNRKIILNI